MKSIHRRDVPPGPLRDALEKARGNALVAALQALGGDLVLDKAAADRARGWSVVASPMGIIDGYPTFCFTLVPTPPKEP